ncbi:MAG: gamma-glutamyl-gamma-aminobutyrate hydrolase family protein [Caulobacterales bacterium]
MPPIIGIILDEVLDPPQDGSAFSRRPFYALRMGYFDAIAAAGGLPIAIPYKAEALDDYMKLCDGWLIPGGDYRFRADWYAQAPPAEKMAAPTLRRDFEIAAASRILSADKPILGICNGMQVLAGVSGGKIAYHGHITRPGGAIMHGDPATGLAHHAVDLAAASRVAAIHNSSRIQTNSAHKEDVVSIGPDASITARAEDGVIEAIEFAGKRFAIGVQWHPELETETPHPLFKALVDAARTK